MNHATRRVQPARAASAAAWALVGALLFAQWLGLAHGVLHAGHAGEHSVASQATAFDGLFGHGADDDAACRLLDQAAAADGLLPTLATVPALAPAALPLPALQAGTVPAFASAYRARAPPSAA